MEATHDSYSIWCLSTGKVEIANLPHKTAMAVCRNLQGKGQRRYQPSRNGVTTIAKFKTAKLPTEPVTATPIKWTAGDRKHLANALTKVEKLITTKDGCLFLSPRTLRSDGAVILHVHAEEHPSGHVMVDREVTVPILDGTSWADAIYIAVFRACWRAMTEVSR